MPTILQLKSTSNGEDTAPNHRHPADQACIYRGFSEDRGHYLHVSINRNGKMFQKYDAYRGNVWQSGWL